MQPFPTSVVGYNDGAFVEIFFTDEWFYSEIGSSMHELCITKKMTKISNNNDHETCMPLDQKDGIC